MEEKALYQLNRFKDRSFTSILHELLDEKGLFVADRKRVMGVNADVDDPGGLWINGLFSAEELEQIVRIYGEARDMWEGNQGVG